MYRIGIDIYNECLEVVLTDTNTIIISNKSYKININNNYDNISKKIKYILLEFIEGEKTDINHILSIGMGISINKIQRYEDKVSLKEALTLELSKILPDKTIGIYIY